METQKFIQNKIQALTIISIIIGLILIINQPILTTLTNPTPQTNFNKEIAIPISKNKTHTTFYTNNKTIKIQSTEFRIGQLYRINNQKQVQEAIKPLKKFNTTITNDTLTITKTNEKVTIPLTKFEYKIKNPYPTKHLMKIYKNEETQQTIRKPKKPRIGEKYLSIGIKTENQYLPIKILKKIPNPDYKPKNLENGEPIATKGIITEKTQENQKTTIKISNKYTHKIELTKSQKYFLKNLMIKKGSKIQIRGLVNSENHKIKNKPIEIKPAQIRKIQNKTQYRKLSNSPDLGKTYVIKGKVIEKTQNTTILQTELGKIKIDKIIKPKILTRLQIKTIYTQNGYQPIEYQIINTRQKTEAINISKSQVGEIQALKGKINEIDVHENGFLKLKLENNSHEILVGVKKEIKNPILAKISINSRIKVIGKIDTYYGNKMIYPSDEEDVILID